MSENIASLERSCAHQWCTWVRRCASFIRIREM